MRIDLFQNTIVVDEVLLNFRVRSGGKMCMTHRSRTQAEKQTNSIQLCSMLQRSLRTYKRTFTSCKQKGKTKWLLLADANPASSVVSAFLDVSSFWPLLLMYSNKTKEDIWICLMIVSLCSICIQHHAVLHVNHYCYAFCCFCYGFGVNL